MGLLEKEQLSNTAKFKLGIKGFILYLVDNSFLDNDYKIAKNTFRTCFKQYLNQINVPISYGNILGIMKRGRFIVQRSNKDIVYFVQSNLISLQASRQSLKLDLIQITLSKKDVSHVKQSFSFKPDSSKENADNPKKSKSNDASFSTVLKNFNRAYKVHGITFNVENCSSVDNVILKPEESKQITLAVNNKSVNSYQITNMKPLINISGITWNQCNFSVNVPSKHMVLFKELINVKLTEGDYYYPIEVTISPLPTQIIPLVLRVTSSNLKSLHAIEPYIYKTTSKIAHKEEFEKIDSGIRPEPLPSEFVRKYEMKPFNIPHDVILFLNSADLSQSHNETMLRLKKLINNTKNSLNPNNYVELLEMLLFMEEHQMRKDINGYNIEAVLTTVAGKNLLRLEVPGLAEHRPSLMRNDYIFVKEEKKSAIKYQGYIYHVGESFIHLRFSKKFHESIFLPNKKFYIAFNFNRFTLKAEHQAVDLVNRDYLTQNFFPQTANQERTSVRITTWYNRNLENNQEQQLAISNIVHKTAYPNPYIIFGPPGTGKTSTVVEAILQIYKSLKSNILVCASSNNAANEIAQRLVAIVPTTDLFRYIAYSFPYKQIPQTLHKYINYRGGEFYHPSVQTLEKYRILVTTLVTASKLVNGGVKESHFDYVIIDESGHSTETETLIAIAGILSSEKNIKTFSGQIVLAGDPQQLGPIVHSTLAKNLGFETSMLERFMKTIKIYERSDGVYNANVLTKLIKNYRSHPTIIQVPKELFYDNELEAHGDNMINVALKWEMLPQTGFPVVFHSVTNGVDERESNSSSFFNVQEIGVVLSYLKNLIGSKLSGMAIRESHIGIISPYKKQVEKLKTACNNAKFNTADMMIGSVEQLQGQERLIILISTVRSQVDYVKFDQKYHLGFLDNFKRMNVAITRAKALLIVVGNPNILQYDPHWRRFIEYCQVHKSIKGTKFELAETTEDIHTLVSKINLEDKNMELNEDGPNFARGNE